MKKYIKVIEDNSALWSTNKDGKKQIEQTNLDNCLLFIDDSDLKNQIKENFLKRDLVVLPKGLKLHTPFQRKVTRYFNETFWNELSNNGKTSFEISKDEILELIDTEEGHIGFKNKIDHDIVGRVNWTDWTDKRLVAKNRKLMEQSEQDQD
tara:strand:- start:507 stop:959 length:453 start_codon:yes stop_codon:yes gene_type:complete